MWEFGACQPGMPRLTVLEASAVRRRPWAFSPSPSSPVPHPGKSSKGAQREMTLNVRYAETDASQHIGWPQPAAYMTSF